MCSFLEELNIDGGFAASPNLTESIPPESLHEYDIQFRENRIDLHLRTKSFELVLNKRRGLALKSLGFASHGFEPTVGTLEHGYFHAIELGADFYTGGVVIELPGRLKRLTDLERVSPTFYLDEGVCRIRCELRTELGTLVKTLSFRPDRESLQLRYDFPGWERPLGTVRVGNVSLLPEGFQSGASLVTRCCNGGREDDILILDAPCDHTNAVSSLISCTAGLGATRGALEIGDQQRGIRLEWDPGSCAAFPMLLHKPSAPTHFTRVAFSLAELDDTRRPGGLLPGFEFAISPVVSR